MNKYFLQFLLALITGNLYAQQPASTPPKPQIFVDDEGQKIAFTLLPSWKFISGTITDKKGHKLAEFSPGTFQECSFKNGTDFIKELKAGYPDDMGNPRFINSRTLVINGIPWTEGIRNVPAWDGKHNGGRWFTHDFFTKLNGRCFKITFFSLKQVLLEETAVRKFLTSVKLLP